LRANVNLYKDDDVIAQLEQQISNLNLDETDGKSKLTTDLSKGKTQVEGEERQVKAAKRKT